jgi:hypothetical protein
MPSIAEQRPVKAALAVIVALALAACGSASTSTNVPGTGGSPPASTTSSPATTTSGATTAPTSSSAAPTITVTTTAAPTSSTTVVSGTTLCRASDLALSFLCQQGATGHGEIGFALRNRSGHGCDAGGYPGILFLDRAGAPLPTVPTHTTQDFFGVAPLRALQVAPGAVVSFRLGVTHGIVSSAGCATAYGLQVIVPNDTATLRVSIPDGAYECRAATVSPLQPGSSAYP